MFLNRCDFRVSSRWLPTVYSIKRVGGGEFHTGGRFFLVPGHPELPRRQTRHFFRGYVMYGILAAPPVLPMKPEDHDAGTDEELVAKYQATGDQKFYDVLWQRHWQRISMQCLRFTGDLAGAEDLASIALTLAWRRIHSFQGGNFSAWLTVIARNCCINHARSSWARRVSPAGEEITSMADQRPEQGCSTEDWTFSVELEQLVNELPDQQRIVVKLFFIDGYSYEQIAGLMQCEVKQVKSHLQNGKKRLHHLWGEPSLTGKKKAER